MAYLALEVRLLVDALMRASAKQNLSELLRVSQRLSLALALVIGPSLSEERLREGIAFRASELERVKCTTYLSLSLSLSLPLSLSPSLSLSPYMYIYIYREREILCI